MATDGNEWVLASPVSSDNTLTEWVLAAPTAIDDAEAGFVRQKIDCGVVWQVFIDKGLVS